MTNHEEMPRMERPMSGSAVSLFGENNDAMEDFPVLKAFQQYIDAEQAKARKRMVALCVFFGVLMACVVSVFVVLLMTISSRNQALSDRLVDYAMKKLEQQPAQAVQPPAAVQPPVENSMIKALTDKLGEVFKNLSERQAQSEKAIEEAIASAKKAAAHAVSKPQETPEQLEIMRLKTLLAAEKEKLAEERERQRRAELEAYRRKQYPELYEKKAEKPTTAPKDAQKDAHKDLLKEVDQILDGGEAISYFEYEDDKNEAKVDAKVEQPAKDKAPAPAPAPAPASAPAPSPAKPEKEYSIPVDIRGSSSSWSVPTSD